MRVSRVGTWLWETARKLEGHGETTPNAVDYFWLCISALAAGAINTLAGGGTLLTFPTLIAVLSPDNPTLDELALAGVLANGTSTVALMSGSVSGAWGFRREMH